MLYAQATESTLVKEVRIAKFTKPEQPRERGVPGAQHGVLFEQPRYDFRDEVQALLCDANGFYYHPELVTTEEGDGGVTDRERLFPMDAVDKQRLDAFILQPAAYLQSHNQATPEQQIHGKALYPMTREQLTEPFDYKHTKKDKERRLHAGNKPRRASDDLAQVELIEHVTPALMKDFQRSVYVLNESCVEDRELSEEVISLLEEVRKTADTATRNILKRWLGGDAHEMLKRTPSEEFKKRGLEAQPPHHLLNLFQRGCGEGSPTSVRLRAVARLQRDTVINFWKSGVKKLNPDVPDAQDRKKKRGGIPESDVDDAARIIKVRKLNDEMSGSPKKQWPKKAPFSPRGRGGRARGGRRGRGHPHRQQWRDHQQDFHQDYQQQEPGNPKEQTSKSEEPRVPAPQRLGTNPVRGRGRGGGRG